MRQKSKAVLKLLATSLCATLAISPMAMAEDNGIEPNISILTDKEEYSSDESITQTIRLEAPKEYGLTNISLKGQIPENYIQKDKDGKQTQWIVTIPNIEAGDTKEETIIFIKNSETGKDPADDDKKDPQDPADDDKKDPQDPADDDKKDPQNPVDDDKNPNDSNKPNTGDSTPVVLWIAILCISLGIIYFTIKKKKGGNILPFLMVVALLGTVFIQEKQVLGATGENGEECIVVSKDILVEGKKITLKVEVTYQTVPVEQEDNTLSYEGYNLKWQDEFNEATLNREDWNVELHAPGWVNAEWQEYVDSEDNIYMEDGKLVIKPIKHVDENGQVSYTSGRINTQNKHNFKYGIFEARVKVPEGKGYLPAFWLMAADENQYGQWPRCGEIDIMEVHGSDTTKSYGTIHYGNPHRESQGSYTLEEGRYSDEFHTFAVEWLPGKINWYMDGVLFHTEDDWYSRTEGQGEITYPAPFDQEFYMILNLAVGGSWVGYPDDTTDFENATYEVDYVRVYQKDSYDENVTKPEKVVNLRDPDENGNYVINGDFAVNEDLDDEKDWIFLLTQNGEATPEIVNNQMVIHTTKEGDVDYSVQLVQPNLPMKKGGTYEICFDAWAAEDRTMKIGVTAPDNGYVRYMQDTLVEVKTSKQTYSYEFTMTQEDDANGRLEFNLGKAGSTADVFITNVTLKKTGETDLSEGDKTVLADGNHVYNGSFQEGNGHLGYWDVKADSGVVSVTSLEDGRRLKVEALEGTSVSNPIVIYQNGLALEPNVAYALSFDAEGEAGKHIDVSVGGQVFNSTLTGDETNYSYKFSLPEQRAVNDIAITITTPGIYYLDNIRIVEDTLIKNGSFNAGLAGYEVYVDGSADASCVVDSLTEDNVADFTINDTGDQGWKIQLKQNNVELEKDQWYRISLDAKASVDRKLMFAIQRDGSSDDNWTPYSGEKIVDLTSDYQTFDIVFQMKHDTDLKSVLSISMGAVGGTQITNQHRICIDNIKLEKIDAPEQKPEEVPLNENLLINPNFADGMTGWENAITPPGEAVISIKEGEAVYNISNVGTEDWNIQLKQAGITLEQGCRYKVSFDVTSTLGRTIKLAMLNATYAWYGGADIDVTANEVKSVEVEFTVSEATDNNITMVISMGIVNGEELEGHEIHLSNFSLMKIEPASTVEMQDESSISTEVANNK